jgi:hypothetical protein
MRIFYLLLFGVLLFQQSNAQIPTDGFAPQLGDSAWRSIQSPFSTTHESLQPDLPNVSGSKSADSNVVNFFQIRPLGFVSGGFGQSTSASPNGQLLAGAALGYKWKNRLKVEAGYCLYIASMPSYLQRATDSLRTLPSAGFAVKDGDNLYHTHIPFGRLTWQAAKYFQVEIGQGKSFFGNGHRSLILSNNAPVYPYARVSMRIWRIHYSTTWAQFRDISAGQGWVNARRKYAAIHALSWNIGKRFNLTAFEMVVWQDRDGKGRRTLDLDYLNPVIFYRPVEYAQGSGDNEILGFGFRWKCLKNAQIYGQCVIDEFLLSSVRARTGWWGNKFGGQAGIRFFDILPGLNIQAEINVVRPFTYTHGSPVQAWGHLNQPLAHPLGNNFKEAIILASYHRSSWQFNAELLLAQYGRDYDRTGDGKSDNFGGNLFRSYMNPYNLYYNKTTQGLKTTLLWTQFSASHSLFGGVDGFFSCIFRSESNMIHTHADLILQAGVRLPLTMPLVNDF